MFKPNQIKDKDKLIVINADSLIEFEQSIEMLNNHLTSSQHIKDIQFQVDNGKFYALIKIGGLDTGSQKEEKPFNVIG